MNTLKIPPLLKEFIKMIKLSYNLIILESGKPYKDDAVHYPAEFCFIFTMEFQQSFVSTHTTCTSTLWCTTSERCNVRLCNQTNVAGGNHSLRCDTKGSMVMKFLHEHHTPMVFNDQDRG